MTSPSAIFVATCDLAAQVRGRSVPLTSETSVLRSGTGWVPANLGLTCFGELADAPFDSTGDLRLKPDATAVYDIPCIGAAPPLRLMIGTQTDLDGAPWAGDSRAFALSALEELRDRFGVRVTAAFEHEFTLEGLTDAGSPFGLDRYRAAEPFGSELLRLLATVGLEPDSWLAEYGAEQFEVTIAPAEGISSADRAVVLRELVRDLARQQGLRASFAPMRSKGGVGSGVHVHFSLRDAAGEPLLWDPAREGSLSSFGSRFAAGIVRHAPALVAMTAPSPASGYRLGEHKWSSSGAYLSEADREALLRICPTTSLSATPPALQYNLEYRAADATGNPWLILGLLVRAGMAGLDADVEEPVRHGPPGMSDHVAALPQNPAAARAALEADDIVRGWFPPLLWDTFFAVREAERRMTVGLTAEQAIESVARVY